ncbi:MAG: patatin-like phospholipase family protein [Ignavibacteria bacterium]|nr:patatin-like phospholipase family protein [Ignavibacteria bacterium]
MKNFAIALGGGGARGLAHIGFLKVLDQNQIKIDAISGCSMGAIVGGLYAYFGNAQAVEEFVIRTIQSEKYRELGIDKLSRKKYNNEISYFEQFFDFIGTSIQILKAINKTSYFDAELTNEIFDFIPDVSIESLKIKFFAVATDLLSGNEIVFQNGSLRKVLQASSAIPGIFPPVNYKNYLLVDGSVTDLVPVKILTENGYDKILAVDVVKSLENRNFPKNILEILYRVESISSFHLSSYQLKETDLLINPEVRQYDWSDFQFVKEIILEGEKSALEHLSQIKKLYNTNRYLMKLRRTINRIRKR